MIRLWKNAADRGRAVAKFGMGVNFDQSQGVKQDDFEACKWYYKAVELCMLTSITS
jgi:hypothetical protein